MAERLDEGQEHPAYLCGRLLAMYEGLQYRAHKGEVNVTVADRYYSMASTMPQLAFPKLETLSHAHLKKLRRDDRGAYVAIHQRLSELNARFKAHGACFPATLSLKDQGRFAIGYHVQRAEGAKAAKQAKQARSRADAQQGNADA